MSAGIRTLLCAGSALPRLRVKSLRDPRGAWEGGRAPTLRGSAVLPRLRVLLLLTVSLLLSVASAHSQAPGSELRVYLMTMGPGDAVWERFGHNAIWVHDPARGVDPAYNYGIFSFDQPGFVRRLMRGNMLYAMAPFDAHQTVEVYAYRDDRSVWVQELHLTPAEKQELYDFLEWNALPANRDYIYDYYRDNCSTRVRDAIDRVLGGALRAALDTVPAAATYRSHSLRLTHDDVRVATGLLLAMGPAVDRPLTAWDEGFIPMELSRHIGAVTITRDDGTRVPLAGPVQTLFAAERAATPAEPPRRLPFYLLAGLLIAGLLIAARRAADRRGRGARVAFAAAAAAWSSVVGFFGVLITLLWALTEHTVTYSNENVLQANPLSLALAVIIPFAAARPGRVRQAAAFLGAVVAGLSIAGLLLKPLPVFGQENAAILALLVPPHLALAWALYPWRRADLSSAGDGAAPQRPAAPGNSGAPARLSA